MYISIGILRNGHSDCGLQLASLALPGKAIFGPSDRPAHSVLIWFVRARSGVDFGAPNRSKFRFWMHLGSTFLLCRFLTDLGGSRTLKNINFTIVKQRFSQNGPVEKVVDFETILGCQNW